MSVVVGFCIDVVPGPTQRRKWRVEPPRRRAVPLEVIFLSPYLVPRRLITAASTWGAVNIPTSVAGFPSKEIVEKQTTPVETSNEEIQNRKVVEKVW